MTGFSYLPILNYKDFALYNTFMQHRKRESYSWSFYASALDLDQQVIIASESVLEKADHLL